MEKKIELRPLVFTILAPFFWSTGGVGLRLADVTPWEVLFWRSIFMALFLFVGSIVLGGKEVLKSYHSTVAKGIWVTVFYSLSLIFYVFSLSNTTVADSLLIQGTAPILIVVLGWILLREPVRLVTVGAVIAVVAGIAVIMIPSLERGGFSGNVYGLIKAFCFAGGTIAVRKRRSVALVPATAVAAAFTAALAAFLIPTFRIELSSLLILAYLGFFQTGIAFFLFVTWSGKLTSSVTGLIVLLEAVLGPLWAWLLLQERPADLTLLGGTIIIAALVIHTLLFYRGKTAKPPEGTRTST